MSDTDAFKLSIKNKMWEISKVGMSCTYILIANFLYQTKKFGTGGIKKTCSKVSSHSP